MRLYFDRVEKPLKILAPGTFIWAVATTSVKLSLISLYLKIFSPKLFKVSAWTAASSVMHAIASILVAAFFCPPFAYYWDLANLCGDDTKLQLSTAVVKMILHFLIVLLPLPILR
ncbi:hypothetical protein BJX68DRAFT_260458 [Aspergillus pseudodeflectus]|uniref:Rhodopsin domain-containing protein n=1 Tax=Aspergillus pseudodeflectus TaxID=176178 RepID=A0ABR4LAT6_9EURO